MNLSQHDLDTQLREALIARAHRAFPEGAGLWPRLQHELLVLGAPTDQPLRHWSWRHIVLLAAACLALLTGTALAASPSLRHLLQGGIPGIPAGHSGGGYSHQGVPFLQPLPAFRVYYPTELPRDLPVRGIGQLNPRYGHDGWGLGYDCPRPPARCPRAGDVFVAPHPTAGLPSLLIPFARTNTDVVWFGSHSIPPGKGFVQLVEWDVALSTVKSLSPRMIPILHAGHPETLLLLTKGRTTIAIDTDLGTPVAENVAASLKRLPPTRSVHQAPR